MSEGQTVVEFSIKNNIDLQLTPRSTILVAVAIHHQDNTPHKIPCTGVPLNGYVYDIVRNFIYLECKDYVLLGSIPISYKITMRNVVDWNVRIPLPQSVIEQYMSFEQRKTLEDFKQRYSNCHIKFVQMIGV